MLLSAYCAVTAPRDLSPGLELNPRLLFRYVLFGIKAKVIKNAENIFKCLLCRMCEVDCRAGAHIADNMRAVCSCINRDIHKHAGGAGVKVNDIAGYLFTPYCTGSS